MTSTETARPVRTGRPLVQAVGIALAVVAFQALLLVMFTWPALHSSAHDLPVVVAGPRPAASQLAGQLGKAQPGAFDVTTVGTAAAADDKLRNREAYAAFVVGPDGVRLHVASAASPQIADIFRQVATGMSAKLGRPVPVTDVVPTDPDDPHGVVTSVGVLPLAITSLIAGSALGLLVRRRWAKLVGLLVYGVLAGLASMAIAQYGLSAVDGHYLLNAANVALLALAISGVVAGLAGLLGPAGIGLGALVMFVAGVPLSGATSSPDLLPSGWGLAGQLLPPGAGATLVRADAFFDGAGATRSLLVLCAWVAVGLVLLAIGRRKRA